MDSLLLHIPGFLVCAAIIIYSGSRLSYFGNRIADLTGMSGAWTGLILMAAVTSLPELFTGISAVAIVKVPNMAAGNVFGSCIFNLLILSILDAMVRKPLFREVRSSHVVAAIFSIILTTIAGLAIYLAPQTPVFLWFSGFTVIIFGVYMVAIWGIFRYENMAQLNSPPAVATKAGAAPGSSLKRVIRGYAFHAMIVTAAAIFIPYFGEPIAQKTGLGNTLFGTIFIAAATSLPELVVSLSLLRMKALDMAVGNLLGSNVFNIFILGVNDIFYKEGSLFAVILPEHLLSVFFVIVMTAVVGLGLLFKASKKQVWIFSLDTFIIVLLYLALMVYLMLNK
jgi:cation:H+ antiporter